MAKLIYSSIASLDGYVADERGNFDWAAPDDEGIGTIEGHGGDLDRHPWGTPVGARSYRRNGP